MHQCTVLWQTNKRKLVQKYSGISEIQQFSCWDILFCLTVYSETFVTFWQTHHSSFRVRNIRAKFRRVPLTQAPNIAMKNRHFRQIFRLSRYTTRNPVRRSPVVDNTDCWTLFDLTVAIANRNDNFFTTISVHRLSLSMSCRLLLQN